MINALCELRSVSGLQIYQILYTVHLPKYGKINQMYSVAFQFDYAFSIEI